MKLVYFGFEGLGDGSQATHALGRLFASESALHVNALSSVSEAGTAPEVCQIKVVGNFEQWKLEVHLPAIADTFL